MMPYRYQLSLFALPIDPAKQYLFVVSTCTREHAGWLLISHDGAALFIPLDLDRPWWAPYPGMRFLITHDGQGRMVRWVEHAPRHHARSNFAEG